MSPIPGIDTGEDFDDHPWNPPRLLEKFPEHVRADLINEWDIEDYLDKDYNMHVQVKNGDVEYEYIFRTDAMASSLEPTIEFCREHNFEEPVMPFQEIRQVSPQSTAPIEANALNYLFSLYHLELGENPDFMKWPPVEQNPTYEDLEWLAQLVDFLNDPRKNPQNEYGYPLVRRWLSWPVLSPLLLKKLTGVLFRGREMLSPAEAFRRDMEKRRRQKSQKRGKEEED